MPSSLSLRAAVFLSTPSARRATKAAVVDIFQHRISIHALREEGDKVRRTQRHIRRDFYPRPPRGGRPETGIPSTKILHFYPRPPRGGRLWIPRSMGGIPNISIHALREEGDLRTWQRRCKVIVFLSTPSARRATRRRKHSKRSTRFLSTPSARRATYLGGTRITINIFLSTPSARRATGATSPRSKP